MDIENELKHWGILGMKWGVRRYQNEDGSLTPEGRERYLKKAREDITKENNSHKIHAKAVDEFNSQLYRINSENEGKNKSVEDWDKTYDKEWKQIYGDLLKKEYGEIASQIYDDEKEWLNNFIAYHLFENEVTHSGILGMKWGVRRYQNPDGSLTLLGRLHYGVGPERKKVVGVNDISALSDDEIRKMSKRYQNQANYYRAKNDYIQQEQYYKQMTAPKKKEHRFLNKVIIQPLENFMAKNAEFAYGAIGYAVLGGSDSDFATQYFNALTNSHLQTKEKKDPEKEEYEKRQKEYNKLKLENDIAAEKLRKTDPHIGENHTSKGGNITTYYDQLNAYYDAKDKYESARVNEAKLINTKMSDFYKNGSPSMTPEQMEDLQRQLDAYLSRYGVNE